MSKRAAAARPAAAAKKQKKQKKTVLKRQDLHKAILQAAAAAGSACGEGGLGEGSLGEGGLVAYLQRQALAAPSPFLTLLGKVLAENEESAAAAVRLIELAPAAGALSAQGGELKRDEGGAARQSQQAEKNG